MKIVNQNAGYTVEYSKRWFLVNADGKILGRLATLLSKYLCGKNKPEYTPSIDVGDYLVVINTKKICVTGNKLKNKKYFHYTGYQSGIREITLDKRLKNHSELVLKDAVAGMLPKGILGKRMLSKLRLYSGTTHPHQGQNLIELNVK